MLQRSGRRSGNQPLKAEISFSARLAGVAIAALTLNGTASRAQTTIWSDSFNGTFTAPQVTGTASPQTYATFASAGAPNTTGGTGNLQSGTSGNETGFSPNYNFGSVSGPLSVSFDFSLNTVFYRFVSFDMGAQAELTQYPQYGTLYNHTTASYAESLLVEFNGGGSNTATASNATVVVQAGTGGTSVTTSTFGWTPLIGHFYHADLTYTPLTSTSFGYTLNVTDPSASGTSLVSASGTVTGTSIANNYMNFGAHQQASSIDNFVVTSSSATPEPASLLPLLSTLSIAGVVGAFRQRKAAQS